MHFITFLFTNWATESLFCVKRLTDEGSCLFNVSPVACLCPLTKCLQLAEANCVRGAAFASLYQHPLMGLWWAVPLYNHIRNSSYPKLQSTVQHTQSGNPIRHNVPACVFYVVFDPWLLITTFGRLVGPVSERRWINPAETLLSSLGCCLPASLWALEPSVLNCFDLHVGFVCRGSEGISSKVLELGGCYRSTLTGWPCRAKTAPAC